MYPAILAIGIIPVLILYIPLTQFIACNRTPIERVMSHITLFHRRSIALLLCIAATCECKIVVNTWAGPFTVATEAAYDALSNGADCLTAVEIGCTACEVNQCDGSVGYGNHPDTHAGVTLDAMIMDGQSMDVGSVAFLSGYRNAASIARAVMEYTTHTLLVGSGAEEFAHMIGAQAQNTATSESLQEFAQWRESGCQPNFYQNLEGCEDSCGPYPHPSSSLLLEREHKTRVHIPWATNDNHDTIGMVAIDEFGHMSCGTTTNGANHKVRGRVGDSPIAGSGCYVNGSVGGCAATGDGDVMMRFSPTFAGVMYMEMGDDPTTAAVRSLQPIVSAFPTFSGAVVCVSNNESFGAATYNMTFQISVMADGMDSVQQIDIVPMTA